MNFDVIADGEYEIILRRQGQVLADPLHGQTGERPMRYGKL